MSKTQFLRWGSRLAGVVLGGVFLAAGIPKLMDPGGFAQVISNYRMLPTALVGPLAVVIPGIEVVVGLALVMGVALRGALVVTQSLLVIFIVALVQGVVRGIDVSCGCFGVEQATVASVGWVDVARDVGLMLVGVLAWPFFGPKAREANP